MTNSEKILSLNSKNIQYEAYRVIRQKINNIVDTSSNDEIAGFVKGVCALEREIYRYLEGTDLDTEEANKEFSF